MSAPGRPSSHPGATAVASKGWLAAHKWLLLRRATQVGVLLVFLAGPWFGLWIAKGNLGYSYTLNRLPLADPYLLLQSVLAGHLPQQLALIGVAIVLAFYLLVGGRTYCAWVCPVNPVTDLASWLRNRLGLKAGAHLARSTRYAALAATLVVATATGTIAWEMVNPVSLLHRGLIFGMGFGWAVIAGIFLFDLFVARRGWCGHLCPVGAFYSLLGGVALVRVRLPAREACDNCMDCFAVCPEQQVIRPALKAVDGAPPVIRDALCTHCGRCIDVCPKDVFAFGGRSARAVPTHARNARPMPATTHADSPTRDV